MAQGPQQPPARAQAEVDAPRDRAAAVRQLIAEAEAATQTEGRPGTPDGVQTAGAGKPPWVTWVASATALIGAAVVAGSMLLGPSSDSVSEATKQSWAASFAAAGKISLKIVPYAEHKQEIAKMGLPAPQQEALERAVAAGEERLVSLTLTDVMAEDDDRVEVESEGYSVEVSIKNEPTRVVIPEPSSGIVNVRGTRDGGGGITIAIVSGSTPVNMPFMTVGQPIGIPVSSAP